MKVIFHSHFPIVLHDVGLFLHVPGVMAIASIPICIVFGEWSAMLGFLATAVSAIALGQFLCQTFQKTGRTELRHAMIVAAVSWALVPLIGALPFWITALQLVNVPNTTQTVLEFRDFWNAVFESFSGFTSTGLTVALQPSELLRSLQWWRSFTEWVGGVGVIVLVLALLQPNTDAYQLYTTEGRQKQIGRTVQATVRQIWWIYLLYTIASIVLLRIVGMPWWDAINHGLTGISTGGFSIRDRSLAEFSPLVQLAVIPIMLAGAVSFSVHSLLLTQRRFSPLWQDIQHRVLWILLGIGTLILMIEIYRFTNAWEELNALFHWTSALGTCGFESANLQSWSPSAKLLLTLAMIVGGTAGSTVGGLKLNRMVVLYKGVSWQFRQLIARPDQAVQYRIEGEPVSELEATRTIQAAAVTAVLWGVAIAVGVFILLHVNSASLSDVLFEVVSALGNVGLSVSITDPELHWLGKLTLIVLMWMGRLEITPVLILFTVLLNFKSFNSSS
jgi:trk system potassium uptake protein